MREGVAELMVHIIVLVAYTILAGILAIIGLAIEYKGYAFALAGETLLGAYVALFGLLLLIVAVLIVRDKLLADITSRQL